MIKMENNELTNILDMGGVTIIDFYAEWCGPCRIYSKMLDKYTVDNSDVNIVKADVEQNSEVAKKYGVRSIPTTVFFKDGQMVSQVKGVIQPAELKKITDNLK